ncbi:hypothetical protein DYB37_009579 [Aphanomyces astaci]|uniref:RING-type domain-containing protein n=1 Tax=Aphanomyces astaci TaxID=112090 RepID=A0A3R6X8Q2_APHAT|nr:hypothetical protein DYB35_007129 [Aphanomyces astaci]RHZ11944.1 hypothetical protein DYB37_009579 [Aphanomyces astaci]
MAVQSVASPVEVRDEAAQGASCVTTSTCQICLEASDTVVLALCGPTCPAIVCSTCIQDYLEVQRKSLPAGVLSTVACPICLIPVAFERWRSVSSTEACIHTVDNIQLQLAASCDVLCPSCHTINNVLPPCKYQSGYDDGLRLDQREALAQFCRYELTISELWPSIQSAPHDQLLQYISHRVQDVERRASLFLRMMRSHPFITSTCCNARLCFTCKTREHHDGVSCEATMMLNDMGQCPNCQITLVKGDGCDYVYCFCKFGFSWSWGLMCFKFSQSPITAKARLNQVFVRYLYRRRFQRQVLVSMVLRIQLTKYRRPYVAICAFLRMRRWRRRLYAVILDCVATVTLVEIQSHRKPFLRVCEYLRRQMWRRRLVTNVLTSPAFHDAIGERRNAHCINVMTTQSHAIRCPMERLKTKMIDGLYRRRMDAVMVAITTKATWIAYWATVTEEDQVALDDDMHSYLGIMGDFDI